MALGITKDAGEKIKVALKDYIERYVKGEYIHIISPTYQVSKAIKGDSVISAIQTNSKALYNLGTVEITNFYKKWCNEIDRLVAGYKSQDSTSATSINKRRS